MYVARKPIRAHFQKKHNLILIVRNAKPLVSGAFLPAFFPSYFGTQGQHSNLVSSGGGCNHSIRSHSGLGCGCVWWVDGFPARDED